MDGFRALFCLAGIVAASSPVPTNYFSFFIHLSITTPKEAPTKDPVFSRTLLSFS